MGGSGRAEWRMMGQVLLHMVWEKIMLYDAMVAEWMQNRCGRMGMCGVGAHAVRHGGTARILVVPSGIGGAWATRAERGETKAVAHGGQFRRTWRGSIGWMVDVWGMRGECMRLV